jgi:glutathione S-transferase
MMQLQTFGPGFGEPDASPFCLKAMCFLHMSDVEWQSVPNSDSRKAPYQKLPVLVSGNDTIADSDNIRQYLEQVTGTDFDAALNDQQRAQSRAVIRMAEDHLYFCLVYDRWMTDESWMQLKKHFFSGMPLPLRWLIPDMVRRNVICNLKGQGMGRLEYSRMLERANKDIAAIKDMLTDRSFLFGDTPTAADVSVVAVLTSIAANPINTGLQQLVATDSQLTEYIARGKRAFFPGTL